MSRFGRVTLAVGLLVAVTAYGCGRTGTTATRSAPGIGPISTACSLITRGEASAAIGRPASPPTAGLSPVEGAQECGFYVTPIDPTVGLGVALFQGMSDADFANQKWAASPYPGRVLRPISGIADQAVLSSAETTAAVAFRKGSRVVVVTLSVARGPAEGPALGLAKAAAGRT